MSESERIGLFVIMSASSFVSDNLYEIVCIDCYFCNVTMQQAWFVRTIAMKNINSLLLAGVIIRIFIYVTVV